MKNLKNFYIDGRWVTPDSTTTLPVLNPATEEQVGTITLGNVTDVNIAVASAKKAFESFSQTTKEERLALLYRLKEVTEKRLEDLAQAMRIEMGAPISMSRDAQADAAIGHLDSFIDALENFEEQQTLSNGDIVIREPIGVCGLITPWNWPINQIVLKVIPALAAGCTCVLKPSEHTPISAMIYAEIIHEAGYPPGVFNFVNGDGETVGSALSLHEDIQMMSFTGSTRAGALVAQNAAPTVKRVTQELGGKSPNIVLADVDLEAAVTRSIMSMYTNTGQSCNAPSRMLVPADKMDEAAAIAAKVTASVVVGDPKAEATTMGPVVSEVQFNKIQSLIQQGIDEGATLVCGGVGRPDGIDKGFFVKPTVFAGVNNNMTVAREEIFGPVLTILPYDSIEEAIEIANDTPYGLAGYIQGDDMEQVRAVASKIRAGNINVNGQSGDLNTPFGGYKQSGNGREWGAHGFTDFLEIKAVSGAS